jgi:glycosyltransferase involved in cell wall biosynthesis
MKKNIALISPYQNAYSETFIQAHKNYFDANVFYYYNGVTQLENEGSISISTWRKVICRIKLHLHISKLSLWEVSIINSFKKHRIDKVYAEYGPTGVQIMPICKKMKLPLIVNFHGFDASVKSTLNDYEEKYKELFDYAEHIVVVSKLMQEKLILLGAKPKKITYTPCAPNDIFFNFTPTFSENAFIAVGRFVDKKAPYYTILAFQEVLKKYSEAKLYFCGDGMLYNTCINVVNYLEESNNVIFLGHISAKELEKLYEKVVGFVQHSITTLDGDMEGTPVAILEASAAGLPVIATKHAGIPDVIQHEKTGLLVNEHDVKQMAEYMILLLDNKEYAKTLGKKGREFVQSNFTMKQHISILNNLLYYQSKYEH